MHESLVNPAPLVETMARRQEDTASQVPVQEDNNISSVSSSSFHIQRPLYFAILFLSLTILADATYTIIFRGSTNGGPLQSFAEFIIPQLVIRYPTSQRLFANEDIGIDGKICPPDGFLDRALLAQSSTAGQGSGVTYSSDYDPRNTKSKPSSFPHCELKKWVQLHEHNTQQKLNQDNNVDSNKGGSRECPKGQEYVTHIYPKQFTSPQQQRKNTTSSKSNHQNVKIIHIATPTNCLPTSTISSLQSFTEHYYNNPNPQIIISIYIHSQEAIDAFLYQRVWNVFPEVKEGLLCGMAKVRFVVRKVLDELLLKGDTTESSLNEKQQRQQLTKDNVANEIATLVKRDIWRYLILWEFGGTVIDWEVLQPLIDPYKSVSSTTDGVTTTDTSPLIKVARQWFASEWFGKSFGNYAGGSSINQEDGDAIITIMDINDGKQRVPLTGVMTSSPNHPLMYFSAKWALRSTIDDNYLVWGESPDFVSDYMLFVFPQSLSFECMQLDDLLGLL